jgi:hypothetical protein
MPFDIAFRSCFLGSPRRAGVWFFDYVLIKLCALRGAVVAIRVLQSSPQTA